MRTKSASTDAPVRHLNRLRGRTLGAAKLGDCARLDSVSKRNEITPVFAHAVSARPFPLDSALCSMLEARVGAQNTLGDHPRVAKFVGALRSQDAGK